MKHFFERLLIILLFSMTVASSALIAQDAENSASPEFDTAGSDPAAIKIADETIAAIGGLDNWNNTRHIAWKFFGRRAHVWDKWTGDYRMAAKDLLVLMNINNGEGKAWKNGVAVEHPDSLAKSLEYARNVWINDGYWLFMPFKLKDGGVTLKMAEPDTMIGGKQADVLELTFKEVGRTPQNKYLVYVDKETRLVGQWDYYTNADDSEPRVRTPWNNWTQFGNIMLSDNRGRGSHSDIAVFEELPAKVYSDSAAVDLPAFKFD